MNVIKKSLITFLVFNYIVKVALKKKKKKKKLYSKGQFGPSILLI